MGGKVGVRRKQGQAPHAVNAKAQAAKPAESTRIAKAIAHAGLCSRRDAEAWIAAGRVTVNGKVLASPAFVVAPGDIDGIARELTALRDRWRAAGLDTPVLSDEWRDRVSRRTRVEELADLLERLEPAPE